MKIQSSKTSSSARVAAIVSLVCLVGLVLGPGLAHYGLLPPLAGFGLFALGLVGGALIAFPLALFAVWRTRKSTGLEGSGRARLALVFGAAVFALLVALAGQGGGVPPIHDVTTDPGDPPELRIAASKPGNAGRDLTYPHGGEEVPSLQLEEYPDLAPLQLDVPPAEALAKSREAAESLGWEEIEVDESAGTLEAVETSRLFRFVDDVVVRVRSTESGSVVDVRSTSRVGESDLGANAARIRAFLAELQRLAG